MTRFGFLAAAAATLLVAGQAQAMSLTNRDAEEMVLWVGQGEEHADVTQITIAPNQTLEDLCPQGCSIAIPDGGLGEFKGDETVAIEGRQFVVTQ